MDISHSLLNLPTYLLFLLIIFVCGGLSILITWFCRKYLRHSIEEKYNEFTGYFFSVIAGFYALILAFVVLQALDQINSVQRDADLEGSLARSLYRQICYYPDSADIGNLRKEYVHYVSLVVNEEYPSMSRMETSDSTIAAFGRVFKMIDQMTPNNINNQAKATAMFTQLTELARYRSLRMLAGSSEIPFIMWFVIFIGGIITMLLAGILHIDNRRYHMLATALMGVFIGLVFFLIIIFDHPFSGSLKVAGSGYESVLKLDKKS